MFVKKIISLTLSAAMLLQSGLVPPASACGVEGGTSTLPCVERKSVDKRIIGAGIGAGVGIPACILLGCLLYRAAHSSNSCSEVTSTTISKFENNFLNNFVSRVDKLKNGKSCVSYRDFMKTCNNVKPLLENDGHVPNVNGPTMVVADLHGDFKASTFYCDKFLEKLKSNPQTNIVFLGDYVDRSENSVEILYMLFKLKVAFPKNVYLLSGNHESFRWRGDTSLSNEIEAKYSMHATKIKNMLYDTIFKCLSFAAVVNNSVFCVHGGVSASLGDKTEPISLQHIRNLPHGSAIDIDTINQVTEDIASSDGFILNNLLWADFIDNDKLKFAEYSYMPRNSSYRFGPLAVSDFLNKNKLKLMVRGHAHPENGKEESRDRKVITLLSVPHYCDIFQNDGHALYFTGANSAGGNPIYEDIICKK